MNLGFIDARATSVDVSVGDRDFTIHQSPTVLSSSRSGGTTGAGQFHRTSRGTHNTELMHSYLEDSTDIRYLALISFQPYSRQHQSHKRLHP